MKKFVLHPAKFKLDGGAMFGIIPRPLWQKKITPDELNRIDMSLRIAYIETPHKKILIDTGIGDYHPEKFKKQFDIRGNLFPIQEILKKDFGVEPNEITDIILSHLHFDHAGGLGQGEDGLEVIFKNAILHLHKKHYEYALKPTLRDSGSFQKHYFEKVLNYYIEKKQIHFIEELEGIILEDGPQQIRFKVSFGHTPYMLHPIFDNYIYMADLVPMSHHVNIPWVMGYDIEPGVTTIYKEKFYKKIMQENLKMVFEHDDNIIGGKIEINEKNRFILNSPITSEHKTSQELI